MLIGKLIALFLLVLIVSEGIHSWLKILNDDERTFDKITIYQKIMMTLSSWLFVIFFLFGFYSLLIYLNNFKI